MSLIKKLILSVFIQSQSKINMVNSKFTEDVIKTIEKLHEEDLTHAEIASHLQEEFIYLSRTTKRIVSQRVSYHRKKFGRK